MRVALHTDQLWSTAPGGIGTYVTQLLRTIPALDAAPEVVTFQVDDPARGATAPPPDVLVPGSIRSVYPRWALTARPTLPAALDGCDVVHATSHAAIPPAAEGGALVVTVHDLAFDRFPALFPPAWRLLYRAAARAAVRRATLLLAPSRATRDDLVARGADPGRVRVTPLAAALPARADDVDATLARLGVPRPFVLCPGTLEPRKNQARLLRAFRQVAPEVPHALVLAGPDGWRSEELFREIDRADPRRVVHTGRLDPGALDALYRVADLVAYPSLYEGFGLPIVEAMARGVAVLTSTAPACAEVAGDAAELVDPLDVAGIADALAGLLGDPARRATLAARGLERAASFSWERTAAATLDAYREAAGGPVS